MNTNTYNIDVRISDHLREDMRIICSKFDYNTDGFVKEAIEARVDFFETQLHCLSDLRANEAEDCREEECV